MKRLFLLVAALVFAGNAAAADPLPSWNEGAAKKSITDFVKKVTTKGSAEFVQPAERIATFDNDGTLWAEQPIYFQAQFALDRLPVEERKAALAGGEKALLAAVVKAHSGMTTDEFQTIVKNWLATAKHPKTGRPYNEMIYQ